MTPSISHQEQKPQALIAEAAEKLAGLKAQLHALDAELGSLRDRQASYRLLDEAVNSLEKLRAAGGADIFREATGSDPDQQLQQLRGAVTWFHKKVSALEQSRGRLQADIKSVRDSISTWKKQLAEPPKRKAQPERYNQQQVSMPYRVLPWSTHGEDELRFRRFLTAFLCLGFLFGGLIPFLRTPVEEHRGVVVPERIARVIKKKQQEIRQEELKLREQADQKVDEKVAEKSTEKAVTKPVDTAKAIAGSPASNAEIARYRKSAETKGVLAFKSDLANLLDDTPLPKMGADARISVNSRQATGDNRQNSIIVSQSAGAGGMVGRGSLGGSALTRQSITGSGGINTSDLDRQVGASAGGKRITENEVKITRVESSAIPSARAMDRSSSRNAGPARTDEEIQLVFDRYKSALYRMYNRELRITPSLRGRMVLQIVIEPDGRVSECTVKTNDLASPGFTADILERVRSFNFGPKEGVPATTILYPIEFLPPN